MRKLPHVSPWQWCINVTLISGVSVLALFGLVQLVLGILGTVAFSQTRSLYSPPGRSWMMRPIEPNSGLNFVMLSTDANPSFVTFGTAYSNTSSPTLRGEGYAFDTSLANSTKIRVNGVYEITVMIHTVANSPSATPEVAILLTNTTGTLFSEPFLAGSLSTPDTPGLTAPNGVLITTLTATLPLLADTSLYIAYRVSNTATIIPGSYWSGVLLYEAPVGA